LKFGTVSTLEAELDCEEEERLELLELESVPEEDRSEELFDTGTIPRMRNQMSITTTRPSAMQPPISSGLFSVRSDRPPDPRRLGEGEGTAPTTLVASISSPPRGRLPWARAPPVSSSAKSATVW